MLKKLYSILDSQEKWMTYNLIFLTLIALFFEVFGLALIFPIISLLIDNSFTTSNIFLLKINSFFESTELKDSPIILLSLIISVFIIKTIFQLVITFQQKRIVTKLTRNLSNKLYASYINQDFIYYTNNNKSKMIQFLQTEMVYFFNFFESLMGLIAELILLTGIYLLVILIEPRGILILTFSYLLAGIIYYKILNRRIKNWGNLRLSIDQTLSKLILETFNVIKEVILNNKFSNFINIFKSENSIKAKYSAFQLTANQLPRIYFELVAIISIIAFIFILIYLDTDSNLIIFILAILGAASFKLLPSVNKVITYYQGVSYYSSSFYKIYNELQNLNFKKEISNSKIERINFKKSIILKNIYYKYSGNNIIFKKINLKIDKGDLIGIKGKSGVGKSTLINLITGLISPTKGQIFFDNYDIKDYKREYQNNIGYVSQNVFLLDESIKKNIAFELDDKLIDDDKVYSSLDMVDLLDWAKNQTNGINTSVGEGGIKISGGQRHRIGIASALYKDPDILIFDEPTSSLDNETQADIMNSIYKLSSGNNKTIIIVSHDVNVLKSCKSLYEIKNKDLIKIH